MSKSNALTKIGVFEIVTGVNSLAVLYLWYELQKIGAEITQRVRDLSIVVQTVNANINTVAQHFKAHLVHHKNVLDVDHGEISDDSSEDTDSDISKEMLLSKIRKLEERISHLEYISNPIHTDN